MNQATRKRVTTVKNMLVCDAVESVGRVGGEGAEQQKANRATVNTGPNFSGMKFEASWGNSVTVTVICKRGEVSRGRGDRR